MPDYIVKRRMNRARWMTCLMDDIIDILNIAHEDGYLFVEATAIAKMLGRDTNGDVLQVLEAMRQDGLVVGYLTHAQGTQGRPSIWAKVGVNESIFTENAVIASQDVLAG